MPKSTFSPGSFILNNYRQALAIIREEGEKLNVLSTQLGVGPGDFERFTALEQEYLKNLQNEPPEVAHIVEYMEALDRLAKAKYDCLDDASTATDGFNRSASDDALAQVQKLDYYIREKGYQAKEIQKTRARCTTSYTRFLGVQEQVLRIEEAYGIVERWTPMSPEYQEALITLNEQHYRRAVDSLERLIIQRLFELAKLGMSGVGMTHLSCFLHT